MDEVNKSNFMALLKDYRKMSEDISQAKKNNTILKNNMTKDKYPNGYHIYIIKDNGLYKIGYTKNLKQRLKQ